MEKENPDDIMLRKDKPEKFANPFEYRLSEPLSDEVVEALTGSSGKGRKGMTLSPYFSVKEVREKGKKKLVAFVGVKGTF